MGSASGHQRESGPEGGLWQLISEYDVDNLYYDIRTVGGYTITDTLELGENTGLESIIYRPRCLDDPAYDGLQEAMDDALSQGIHTVGDLRPPVRDGDGAVLPGMDSLVAWEGHAAVLDTFYWSTSWEPAPGSEVAAKRAKTFYEFIDRNVLNGFMYFYSVTATDHRMYMDGDEEIITGPGVTGDPSTSFAFTSPGTDSRSAEDIDAYVQRIYVYPNPATREALANFQEFSPTATTPRACGSPSPISRGPQPHRYLHPQRRSRRDDSPRRHHRRRRGHLESGQPQRAADRQRRLSLHRAFGGSGLQGLHRQIRGHPLIVSGLLTGRPPVLCFSR